jgi:hypothetical protein
MEGTLCTVLYILFRAHYRINLRTKNEYESTLAVPEENQWKCIPARVL